LRGTNNFLRHLDHALERAQFAWIVASFFGIINDVISRIKGHNYPVLSTVIN